MPRGTYLHVEEKVEERFQCAPGPGGWRYIGERSDGRRVDLVVDARWRQIRVEVLAPGWWIRGGVTGYDVAWVRGAHSEDEAGEAAEHGARAHGFLGESPGFLVTVARSLRLAEGGRADVRLVRLGGPALSALTVAQRWRLGEITAYETETEPLPVARYEVVDLATGETDEIHIAGDVVVAAPGVELTDLDSPPHLGDLGL
ncbi:hypothetical protein Arub01_00620 [Actinomadura rubrobrunea]|uniref:Uncharacterized protein n=1 Tax=Actinomadura rubrobrunea TaxID=115335 RepID=A0A9W6UTJ0_9ACTN|nr:hypothetical protein [Actinomadura rubrobrunea]GLW61818.1 hypothetical protein Arub01_00620 [Actinomadura rubrobrunea]